MNDPVELVNHLDKDKLALILIFGTGLVASLLWGVSQVIGALRNDLANGNAIRAEVAALEDRVAALEHGMGSPANAGNVLLTPSE